MRSFKSALCVAAFSCCACAVLAQETKLKPRTLKDIPLRDLRATLKGYSGNWQQDTARHQGLPEPPRQKTVSADAVRIKLPELQAINIPLSQALFQRRSRRIFTKEPMNSGELGFLLWSAQGVTLKAESEGGRSFRTAPSAGGRYPLEAYVVALKIKGVPCGIHRYLPDTHELVTVRTDPDLPSRIVKACYGQAFVGDAAAVIVWAAVPERTEWKYAYLSPRLIAMEAGHVCQNLYLACEALGAGVCALLAYDQPQLDALLGVDGEEEFAIYLAAVGKVAE